MAKQEEGASGNLAVLVAAVVLLASLGALMWASREGADPGAVTDAIRRSDAESLAQMFADSPGAGWELGADHMVRLGLMEDNRSGISLEKTALLRGATYEAQENSRVDYAESLKALGIAAGAGEPQMHYHLRIYPVGLLKTLEQTDLGHIRTMYIGDWASLHSVEVALHVDEETMVEEANLKLDAQMALHTLNERQMLRALGLGYSDRIHIAALPDVQVEVLPGATTHITGLLPAPLLAGDVYPDHKQVLDLHVAARIGGYDLVVVGSGVAQSALTSDVTKSAIAQWVLDGGTLMVLGTGAQDFQWLQPLFSLGTSTINGQAFAPDIHHPMLQEPHRLDWTAYDHHGITWNLKDRGARAHHDDFEHVITAPGSQKDEDILAVSKDGAFGAGRVFLTGYQPRLIAEELGMQEATHFIHNMVVYADRAHLYLDYGPPVPEGAAVAGAVRHSHVWDPDLGQVPVRMELLLWLG